MPPDTSLPTLAPPAATRPIAFDNSYARLPDRFFARLDPTRVAAPRLIRLNTALADALGLDLAGLAPAEAAAMFSGNTVPPGAAPIAQAYAGHQFGQFSPQLGDGRAILLGEIIGRDGQRRDIQLKGAGPTPFSRRGDGRAALGPVLREYIVSEAMAALGIPTTRALAATLTGEPVYRETPLPGAVLTRVAASHIRVGTFQYFAATGDSEAVRLLADYAIARHYPDAQDAPHPYRAFFAAICARHADLIAQWLLVGFIHGVMNTDNSSISGETIDFGPCAFLDAYDPATVFSSIDYAGRYAYANQPSIARWNLARLAECLLPLLAESEAEAVEIAKDGLAAFATRFRHAYSAGLLAKIGLATPRDGDETLVQDLLQRMTEGHADFTLTFRQLCDAATTPDAPVRTLFDDPTAYDSWATHWHARLAQDPTPDRQAAMRARNPAFIPRNHRVEQAIVAAVEHNDFAPFERLVSVLQHPFDDQPEHRAYMTPPQADERVLQTFCGT